MSRPHVDYILICDHAFPDFQGKMSAIGIFDTIAVATLPAAHPELYIVARLAGEPGEVFTSKIRILDPSDEVVNESTPAKVQLKGAGHYHMYLVRALELNTPGRYLVQVLLDGETAGSTRLVVKQQKPKIHEVPRGEGGAS